MVQFAPVVGGLLVALVGGGVSYFLGRRHWRRRKEIKGAQQAQAGSLRPGAVELQGQARPATDLVRSPLTGRDCLAYEFRVEEKHVRRRQGGQDGSRRKVEWRTVESDTRAEPFYVADGSGQAMVDAPAADLELERAYSINSDEATASTTEKVLATVTGGSASDGEDLPVTDEWLEDMRQTSKERRYYERLILPNESVYVYGEAMPPNQVGATGGGVSGGLGGLFGGDGSLVDVATSMLSGGPEAYRRASRRGPQSGGRRGPHGGQSPEPPGQQERAEMQASAERLQELQRKQQQGELSQAERQELQSELQRMQSQTSDLVSGMTDTVEDVAGPDREVYANERLVVSRGDAVGEFVVSDRGKSGVVSGYTKGVLKWGAVLVGSVGVGAYLVVSGLGLV